MIECKTYRYKGHARFEPSRYRPKEELEKWLRKDPIARFKKKLIGMSVLTSEEAAIIEKEILRAVEDAVRFAEESPLPDPDSVEEYVYA